MIGLKIKEHEDNVKNMKAQKNSLDDSILDMQVNLGKYHSSSMPMMEDEDHTGVDSEEEPLEHIIGHEKSAAGILCLLKTRHGNEASNLLLTKDVLGIVATLGKVDDDNLSRLLSEYLGIETMLAVVCKTYDGVKALETYENDGSVSKSSGLHGLGTSIGRHLDGRFQVICLENLRRFHGEFVAEDPQMQLDLFKPRLPNGETPRGFLGFAVNMVNIDNFNLFCVTADGHGLRETLFYNLFSHLQVYSSRADMLQALPCISDGAISLDGGIIKTTGMFSLGDREGIDVKFPKSHGASKQPANYFETEKRIKEMQWKKERVLEDTQREQALLDNMRINFEMKKQEFVKYLAESAVYATQAQAGRDRLTPR
ncbi:protein DEFECTIVE IN MERISTEM SILENCING 3-like isoform X2 [Camellia sinensis]|nr:protein DEFECTIVE IN MERISTEM SILENCING 3-like isoform X2 [Camellia sinensis]